MGTTSPTLYDLLGVSSDASTEQIKQAYRRQQRATHPDTSGSEHTQHWFVMITNAYTVLSDPQQRRDYDRSLHTSSASTSEQSPPPTSEDAWGEESVWGDPPPASAQPYAPHIPGGLAREVFTPTGFNYVAMKPLIVLVGLVNLAIFGIFALTGSIKEAAITYGSILAVCALYAYMRRGKWLFTVLITAVGVLSFVMFGSLMQSGTDLMANIPNMIALLIAFGGVGTLLYLAFKIRTGRWNTDPRNTTLLNLEAAQHPIWGSPAGELDNATAKFGEDKVSKGVIGERKTALALETLLQIPGVRIFHGLKYPIGNGQADVDHLVMCGDKIALIDSKYWSGADYSWDGYDTILENGRHVQKGVTHFPKAVDAYANIFHSSTVKGFVLIHSNNSKPVTCDNSKSQGVALGDERKVLNYLAEWFTTDHTGEVNRRTMHQILSWMK